MEPLPPLAIPSSIRRADQRKRARLRWWRRCFFLFECSLATLAIGYVVLMCVVWNTSIPKVWSTQNTLSLRLLDRDGHYLVEKSAKNGRFGVWLPGHQIPKHLRVMTMAAEDHRLYEHTGVDVWSIVRALWSNVRHQRRVSGASTLAMQLVRQFRPAKRTYRNKLREMFWALVLRSRWGAEGVMREYLNRAPYGNRVQGAQRASLMYFDRPAADLSLAQAAFLVALPWGPGHLNPFSRRGRRRALRRSHRILKRALQLGWISLAQYQEALSDALRVQKKKRRVLASVHFTQRILRYLKRRRKVQPSKRWVTLKTTLDLSLQKKVHSIVRTALADLNGYGAGTGAVVVMDHRSGEVLSYVGSHDYFSKRRRGAIDFVQVRRSPGSTLKPFIYAHAIEKKLYTGATLLSDLAQGFLWKRGAYHPRNYDFRMLGPLRMRVALGNSRNIPALRTLARVGVDSMLERFRQVGFQSLQKDAAFYGLGLALGAGEVSLMELVRAYALLARAGEPMAVKWASKARDSLGRWHDIGKQGAHVFASALPDGQPLRPAAARMIAHILSDPVARLPSFGRYGVLEFPFPVAVKTGTSQAYRDAWMVGFSDRVVVGCWVGNHDYRKMKRLSGARGCGEIFQRVMLAAMEVVEPRKPAAAFSPPRHWVKTRICPLSGMPRGDACPGVTEEWFPPNFRHRHQTCSFHKSIRLERLTGLRVGPHCPAAKVMRRNVVVVPPRFTTWARWMGHTPPPTRYSALCPRKGRPATPKKQWLRIRSPLHRARFLLDPTIPADYSTLALQVESKRPVSKITWMVNGAVLGRKKWPYTMRWSLRRGTHRFVAMTSDGQVRSKPVVVYVR